MFKMFPPTFLVVPIAWMTVLLLALLDLSTPALEGLGIAPKVSWCVLAVQLVMLLLIATPLWRCVWRIIPQLNDWVYPDLNGEWEVAVASNVTRIDAVFEAAKSQEEAFDFRLGPEAMLVPLGHFTLRARIRQSWLSIDVDLWDPTGAGPIEGSTTLIAEPVRGKNGRHALAYMFDQTNKTDVVSDAGGFRGAVWITRDRTDANILSGRMWSDRMWRRGLNTAADLRFVRVAPASPAN